MLTAEGIARPGDAVVGGGVVTSGTFSPSLEVGIGMAYLPLERAGEGSEFEIDVRGRSAPRACCTRARSVRARVRSRRAVRLSLAYDG